MGIDEESWIPIDYTEGGEAWVAETTYGDGHRLVVRRTRLADPQPALFPVFRYHAFITDRGGNVVALDADHRRHAVIELAIRDLKEGSGLADCPSGRFGANGAWAVLSTIAHNLLLLGRGPRSSDPRADRRETVRRRFLAPPGRITHRARHRQLHLPANWPWAEQWTACFTRLSTCYGPEPEPTRSPAARPDGLQHQSDGNDLDQHVPGSRPRRSANHHAARNRQQSTADRATWRQTVDPG